MREDYDIVEDIGVKRHNGNAINKFTIRIVIALSFVILCAGCFNLVYLLSFKNIESNQETSTLDKSSSKKIFLIEEKLRKDLSKIQHNN